MKFSCVAIVFAAAASVQGASLGKRNEMPDIDVDFFKTPTRNCVGEGNGGDTIHTNDCKTFDNRFWSYMVQEGSSLVDNLFGQHDDFTDPRCGVIIYGSVKCTGDAFSAGSFALTKSMCIPVPFETGAKSASVKCDGTAPALAEQLGITKKLPKAVGGDD